MVQKKPNKRSRRAQRRERLEAKSRPTEEAEADEDEEESDEDSAEDVADEDDGDSDESDDESEDDDDESEDDDDESEDDDDESEDDDDESEDDDDESEDDDDESEDDDDESEDDDDESEGQRAAAPPLNRAQRRAEKSRQRRGVKEQLAGQEAIRERNRNSRESAAKRRRAKRQGKKSDEQEVAVGLEAHEMVDDVLARASFKATRWLRQNSFVVQSVVLLSFVGLCSWTAYRFFSQRARDQRSDTLFVAIERHTAHVGEPVEALNPALLDPRPTYATGDEMLADAETAYREAATAGGAAKPTTMLARLGLATTLLQEGKSDEALAEFEAVKGSKLAKDDTQVRGRAMEGIAMALEAKGDQDAAVAAYQELENTDIPRFSKLALYHRARLAFEKGDTSKAKELVTSLQEKIGEIKDFQNPGYVAAVTLELAMAIDPDAPAANPLQLMKQVEEMQRNAKSAMDAFNQAADLPIDLNLNAPPKTPPQPKSPPKPASSQ